MNDSKEYQKLRGGYYTPTPIAKFLANWAIESDNDIILEPSCGDGQFIRQVISKMEELGVYGTDIKKHVLGIELDSDEAAKAGYNNEANIVNSDFFTYYRDHINNKKKFDVVLGNPPFIRYQEFNNEYRDIAFDIMKQLGFKPSKMSNIWMPFLVLASSILKEDGRLGMVIPTELFQVDYAAETRKFLTEFFEELILITFEKLLFEGAQQEVVLVMGKRKSENPGIRVYELTCDDDLKTLDIDNLDIVETKDIDVDTEKWIKYFLTKSEIDILRKVRKNKELKLTTDLFEVNVGVVSGQNKFFIVNNEVVDEYNLKNSTRNIVGKSEHLKGLFFNNEDRIELQSSGKGMFLFTPNNEDVEKLSEGEQKYINFGEDHKYNTGYKCRIRKRWYIVPQSWDPQAFMLRQVHECPKLIFNNTDSTTTDTLHKIRFLDGVKGEEVCGAFLNSLTLALSEVTGRSYGGGVLTFEPGEVRKLLIPMNGADELDLNRIDTLLRENKINDILEMNDNILLKKHLGLTNKEVILLRGIWVKLKDRRINRKKK